MQVVKVVSIVVVILKMICNVYLKWVKKVVNKVVVINQVNFDLLLIINIS